MAPSSNRENLDRLFVHGYAGIIVNNALEYEEELIKVHLERAYNGAILAIQEEMK